MSAREPNYAIIPLGAQASMKQYLEIGCPVGSFLQAVLSNDLKTACERADHINRYHLFDYILFLANNAPAIAWGSPDAYDYWTGVGGMRGLEDKKKEHENG
jgi:hypothetical protein